jgi:hypothetical protein
MNAAVGTARTAVAGSGTVAVTQGRDAVMAAVTAAATQVRGRDAVMAAVTAVTAAVSIACPGAEQAAPGAVSGASNSA